MAPARLSLFLLIGTALCLCAVLASNPHKLVAKTASKTPRLVRPEGVDPELDCGIRKLALQFAGTLLESDDQLSSVHDALQLGALCGLDRPSESARRSVRSVGAAAVGDVNIYVDPVNGDDANSGVQGQPVKTIAVAVQRTRVAGRGLAAINLQGGVYRPDSTILLGVADSNLTIQVDPSSQSFPFVSAAAALSLSWTQAKGSVYVATVDPSVRPFTQLFVGSDEQTARRAIRARYPNCNPETCGLHTNFTGYVSSAQSWLPPAPLPAAVEVDISSPFRDRSFFSTFSTGIGGPAQYLNPPNAYWAIAHGGAGSAWQVPSGLTFNSTDLPHASTWSKPSTGVVHAFHSGHWGNWQFPIDSMPNASTIAFGVGGYQEARGSTSGSEYYVENIFEELDSPNEWFFDEDSYQLYFFANGTHPSELQFFASQLETLFSVTGSSLHPVSNVVFSGVNFAYSATTFLSDYEEPSGGDATVHRGGAVFVEGAVDFTMRYCKFYSIGGNALFLSNYVRGASILKNEFVWLGDSAILAVGSTEMMDGTTGEQPRGTLVEGNLAHEIGVFGKQTSAYFQSLACQTTIRGNVFFNGPRAGVNFNDGFGGGNVVEGNLMFNFVRETSDHGPFNSWDRQPYLTDLFDGTPSLNISENYITRNFILSAYHTSWPIDHDDGSVYYTDSFNLLVYGGFKSYWGHSKKAVNNLYIHPELSPWGSHCMNDYGQDTQNNGWGEAWTNNTCVIASAQVYDLGNCNYPDPTDTIPALAFNAFFVPDGQLSLNCGGNNLTLQQFQAMGFDVGSTVQGLPSTQATLDMIVNFLGL